MEAITNEMHTLIPQKHGCVDHLLKVQATCCIHAKMDSVLGRHPLGKLNVVIRPEEGVMLRLGPGLSRPSTYQLWLQYKVCHALLVMDSGISQHQVSHV